MLGRMGLAPRGHGALCGGAPRRGRGVRGEECTGPRRARSLFGEGWDVRGGACGVGDCERAQRAQRVHVVQRECIGRRGCTHERGRGGVEWMGEDSLEKGLVALGAIVDRGRKGGFTG